MAIESKNCPECNGSGRVLKHTYDSGTVARSGHSAGMGMINCPRCHGSGKVQGYVSDGAAPTNTNAAPANAYGFAIFVFMCCFTWAAVEINSHVQIAHKYEVGFFALIASFIIGIFIRDLLVKLLGLMLLLGILYLVFAVGYYYFFINNGDTNVVTKTENASDIKTTSPSKIARGTEAIQIQLETFNIPEDMQGQCAVCSEYMAKGVRYDTDKNKFLATHCTMQRGSCTAATGIRY